MTTCIEPRISVASPASHRPNDRTLTLTFAPDAPLALIRDRRRARASGHP